MDGERAWNKSGDSNRVFEELDTVPKQIMAMIAAVVSVMLALSLLIGGFELIQGDADSASVYTPVASSLATVLLVVLTAWYATETRRMVRETERSRRQEREEYERQRRREVQAVRRALYEEISAIEGLDEFGEEYDVTTSLYEFPIPTTIYEANGGKIGLLSQREADDVIEYYTRVAIVQNMMDLQRDLDTTVDMDALTEYLERSRVLINKFLRKISFGHWGGRTPDDLTERIQEEFEGLAQAQEEAIASLEENLENPP